MPAALVEGIANPRMASDEESALMERDSGLPEILERLNAVHG